MGWWNIGNGLFQYVRISVYNVSIFFSRQWRLLVTESDFSLHSQEEYGCCIMKLCIGDKTPHLGMNRSFVISMDEKVRKIGGVMLLLWEAITWCASGMLWQQTRSVYWFLVNELVAESMPKIYLRWPTLLAIPIFKERRKISCQKICMIPQANAACYIVVFPQSSWALQVAWISMVKAELILYCCMALQLPIHIPR